mmetsp:Transcript_16332/g.31710  ORF Transcript_16332/g.31710 Transcript_16332/m.31710 type:complete len:129 (+) Transcript_16332:108-494(+)
MADLRTKRVLHENTYQTTVSFKEKFPVSRVQHIIQELLEDRLKDQKYQADMSSAMCKEISDEVKRRIKDIRLNRYKIIVQTVIGEKRGQGVRFGTRCFWDSETDASATASYSNESLFAVVVAYGVWVY